MNVCMILAIVDVPLIVAGSLALLAATIHGVGGEVLVVRQLSPEILPSTRFGGPGMTRAMLHVSWHLATVAFFAVGSALLLSGSVLHGDLARGIGLVGAAEATGFAVVTIGLGIAQAQFPRALVRHPGPAVLTATAALAWWGAL
jgi:hypothetical protein